MVETLKAGMGAIALAAIVAGIMSVSLTSPNYKCAATGLVAICDAGISSTGSRCYYWKDATHKGYVTPDCPSKWEKYTPMGSAPIAANGASPKASGIAAGEYTDFILSADGVTCNVAGNTRWKGVPSNGKCIVG